MDLFVRPARPEDPCVPLLFESAKPYYTAYAGSERRALKLFHAVFARTGPAASYGWCQDAIADGELVGIVAGFPVRDGDRLSQRFVALTLPRLPPWRWPGTFRHLKAAGGVSPNPPYDAYYVDALGADADYRRQGVAHQLLKIAEHEATKAGLRKVALDTGLQNAPA